MLGTFWHAFFMRQSLSLFTRLFLYMVVGLITWRKVAFFISLPQVFHDIKPTDKTSFLARIVSHACSQEPGQPVSYKNVYI